MARRYIPNAWERVGDTYYVAQKQVNASDDNPGTRELPLKTVSAAAAKAREFDEILIDEGVYREQVPIIRHGIIWEASSHLLFRAVPGKEVYLTGADPFDAEWEEVGHGTYKAKLPEPLFAEGTYNPYELSCVVDEPGKVRPTDGPDLPETLGQIYVDDEPLKQLTRAQAVQDTPNSFVVSAGGKEVICHFADGKAPPAGTVELTVRERCFKPTFEVDKNNPYTVPMMHTRGMVIERAADPGPFSTCRPLTIRRNPGTGIVVRKTLDSVFHYADVATFASNLCYLSKDKPMIFCARIDRSVQVRNDDAPVLPLVSDDGAHTWREYEGDNLRPASHFLDEENGMLVRYWRDALYDDTLGTFGENVYHTYYQVSPDGGQTWSEPEELPLDKAGSAYDIVKLQNGQLLWCALEDTAGRGTAFEIVKTFLGTWRDDPSGVDWELTATLEVDPGICSMGLSEPHACQFPDGRIFVIMRQGNVLASQEASGFPSVKLFCVSADLGKTWTAPKPLTYDDGKYVYSSRSFPDTFRSSKNGKPYVIININEESGHNCDPRTVLQIAELSTDPVALKRDTVAIIDEKLPEHHHLVRVSNWVRIEERGTRNMLLFMKLQMAEYCPIRNGYDFNCYRYEIILPD